MTKLRSQVLTLLREDELVISARKPSAKVSVEKRRPDDCELLVLSGNKIGLDGKVHRMVSCWNGPPKLWESLVAWERRYLKLSAKDVRPRIYKSKLAKSIFRGLG